MGLWHSRTCERTIAGGATCAADRQATASDGATAHRLAPGKIEALARPTVKSTSIMGGERDILIWKRTPVRFRRGLCGADRRCLVGQLSVFVVSSGRLS